MNKIVKIVALCLCAASAFALSACSGCNSTTSYKATTSPNWLIRTSSADELDASSPLLTYAEQSTYSITHSGAANGTYSFEYGEGVYTTKLYAQFFNWSTDTIGEYAEDDLREYVYVYETTLTLPVTVVVGDERSEQFVNEISTVSYFASAANNLRPVYSKQDIKSVTPNVLQASSLSGSYVEMDCIYETHYSQDGRNATTSVTYRSGGEGSTSTASTASEYTVIDSSALAIALRSLTQSGTPTFDVYVGVNGSSARYQAAWGSAYTLDREDASLTSVISALDDASDDGYLLTGLTDGVRQYSVKPVVVSLVSSMAGPSTTYHVASVTNTDMNAGRAVIVRMEETVPFNLGTLTYDLQSLTLV